jgi:hypothetical protein
MPTMFARYFVELAAAPAAVEAALLQAPAAWMSGLAAEADNRGRRLLVDVGAGRAPHRIENRIEKRVLVTAGKPVRMPSRTVVPLTWEATGPGTLFPRMDADLELASLGPHRTQLSISATYAPPLGPLGQLIDRALLHRLAEATVKDFLDRAGSTLERLALEEQAS